MSVCLHLFEVQSTPVYVSATCYQNTCAKVYQVTLKLNKQCLCNYILCSPPYVLLIQHVAFYITKSLKVEILICSSIHEMMKVLSYMYILPCKKILHVHTFSVLLNFAI